MIPFSFSLFSWIYEVLRRLFDDEGIDIKVGTADLPEGSPTHVAVGIEINIDLDDDKPEPPPTLPPADPFDVEPDDPFHWESGEDDGPDIKIDLVIIHPLNDLTDDINIPNGFPGTDFDFGTPTLEPGESGIGFGIKILEW